MFSCGVVIILFVCFTGTTSSRYREYYLEDECKRGNENISYLLRESERSSFILKATRKRTYEPSKNCTVSLRTAHSLPYGVIVSIRKIAMTQSILLPECIDYIKLYGPFINSPVILCKHNPEEVKYYQSYGSMNFLYHTEKMFYRFAAQTGFEIVVTAYNAGICTRNEFRCANGNCIWKGLMCDGYNNCGDNSDEDPNLCVSDDRDKDRDGHDRDHRDNHNNPVVRRRDRNLPIILSCVGTAIAAITITIFFYMRLKRRRVETAAPANAAVSPSTAPSYDVMYPPPYSVPHNISTPSGYNPHYPYPVDQSLYSKPYYTAESENVRPPPYAP